MKRLVCLVVLASCAHVPHAIGPALPATIDAPVAGHFVAAAEGTEVSALVGDGVVALHGAVTAQGHFVDAALVPSPDGQSPWLLVVDAAGALLRVRDGGRLEDVRERFGVAGAVRGLCAIDASHAAFFLADGLVLVGDGHAGRYAARGRLHACGGGKVAIADQTLALFDTTGSQRDFRFSAHALAIDESGTVWASHGARLYRVAGESLVEELDGGTTIDGLAMDGARVVLQQRGALSVFDGHRLSALEVPRREGRLLSGASSVWIVDGGAAQRVRIAASTPGFDPIASIAAHSCGTCHRPGGRGGFSLSGESDWETRRDDIRTRVVVDRDMPPEGAPAAARLTDAERAAIGAWLTSK